MGCLIRGIRDTHPRYDEIVILRKAGISLFCRRKKTRYIAATGFSYLKPGNVLLSHSKCYTIIGAVSFHY